VFQDEGVGVLVEKMQWACVDGSNRAKSERPPESFDLGNTISFIGRGGVV